MIAKIYKINYKNRYFPIWDYASAEVIFAPAETSAVALGRRSRYRITPSLKELQPSRRLAIPHWSALEEVSAS